MGRKKSEAHLWDERNRREAEPLIEERRYQRLIRERQLKAIFSKMQRRGLSQSDLARKIGCDQSRISRAKKGEAELSSDEVRSLIDYLEVTQSEIDDFSERVFPAKSPESLYRLAVLRAIVTDAFPLQSDEDVRIQLDSIADGELADLAITQNQRLRVLESLVQQGYLRRTVAGQLLPNLGHEHPFSAVDHYEEHIRALVGYSRLDAKRSVLEKLLPVFHEVNAMMEIDEIRFDIDAFMLAHRDALMLLARTDSFYALIANGASRAVWIPLELSFRGVLPRERPECALEYATKVSLHLRKRLVEYLAPEDRRRVLAGHPLPGEPQQTPVDTGRSGWPLSLTLKSLLEKHFANRYKHDLGDLLDSSTD